MAVANRAYGKNLSVFTIGGSHVLAAMISDATIDISPSIVDATLELRESTIGKVEGGGKNITGSVTVDAPYAVFVEKGSKPHFLPVKVLEQWVRRKFKINNPQAVRQAAFLVGRKISREGIKPTHFFRKSINVSEPRIRRIFNDALDTIANKMKTGG